MILPLLMIASASCDTALVDAPYVAMMEGFEERSPARVAEAYADPAILGRVDEPRVRGLEAMTDVFAYVAPEDGSRSSIAFRILYRDRGEGLVGDVGLYRIRSPRGESFGKFTTVISCGEDGVWRFVADLMSPGGEEDWQNAECAERALCAED